MNVDPMSRFNTRMANQTKTITLEGKSRLPARLQEAVIDIGNILQHAQSTSASGEVSQIPQLAKNLNVLETTMNNTMNTLKKIEKTLNRTADKQDLLSFLLTLYCSNETVEQW